MDLREPPDIDNEELNEWVNDLYEWLKYPGKFEAESLRVIDIALIGGQITFPATAVPSADPNTIDDYEEGTWTPVLEGSITAGNTTYTVQVGRYEKIGRQVTIRGRITVNVQGTLNGNVSIIGLPFTANADVDTYGSVVFGYAESLAITASESLTGLIIPGASKINIVIWNSSVGTGSLDDAELTDGASFMFAAVYHI